MKRCTLAFLVGLAVMFCGGTDIRAATIQYGDQDVLGTGTYSSNPISGATLEGLAPNVITLAALITSHVYPFSPSGDYSGTDQIYVGSIKTGSHDGYSGSSERLNGPQVVIMNYSTLVPAGHGIQTLTLGIAADDFQNPMFGQPFSASVNGVPNGALTTQLNALTQTGPRVQFLTIGIDPSILTNSHILTLNIDQGGDGGDGWAIDFLTVGTTTAAVIPLPAAAWLALPLFGGLGVGRFVKRRRAA